MFPLSSAVLKEELESVAQLVRKWQERLDEGIPGEDTPSNEQAIDDWLRQFCGEMMLMSSKLESMAGILSGGSQ